MARAARKVGDILEQAGDDHDLEMESLTDPHDPDLAIDTVRAHLAAVEGVALGLYPLEAPVS